MIKGLDQEFVCPKMRILAACYFFYFATNRDRSPGERGFIQIDSETMFLKPK